MATIDPFLQDAAFDPGALQAMSTAPLVRAFSWNDPGRLRVIRPNQQRVNGTGKCRQFIRKAIRPCSRVAFSIRLYAQDEVEKAVNRRELIEDVWLELTHKLDKLPLEDAAPVRQALDFFLDLIVTDSSLAPPWAGFSVGSPLFVRTRRELLPRPPAYSGKLRRLRPMRTPRWLRFALNPKSDELNKIRRRTDQMLMHQEAQKEQEGAAPEREITQAK